MSCEDYVRKMRGIRLLIVGDPMLDSYEQATIKDSQEKFSPVYAVTSHSAYLGGAANAAAIAYALGSRVKLIGAVGDDAAGSAVCDLFPKDPGWFDFEISVEHRPTTQKVRTSAGEVRFRRDRESVSTFGLHSVAQLIARMEGAQPYDAVLFSDYDKGLLRSPGIIQAAMSLSPLRVLDPKFSFAPFEGVQYTTPNEKEAGRYAGVCKALDELPGAQIIETCGSHGARIHRVLDGHEFETRHVATAEATEVDACGAGDAFAAGFTLAKAAGADVFDAVVVGQGVARWWVLHERSAVLSIPEVENQVAIVEDANS
jgi:D-beta-D-heptose 7-phosphate kinase/D-beta-D-heptose 1-phosphate adenosyltransferase